MIKCKKCKGDITITEKEDLVQQLYIVADGYGTTVEMISMESEEGEMLMRAFNGIAGVLRYKVGE